MMERIREAAANFLFPTRAFCLCCGDPAGLAEEWLCDACMDRLAPRAHELRSGQWPEDGISRVWFPLYYERPISKLIWQFKYNGVYRLAPFFAACMGPVLVRLTSADYDCLTPIPLHDKRLRERGFNQAEVLASYISRETGIPLDCAVRRTRNTGQQARLSTDARQANLQDAFECTTSFQGRRVLLVDDVFTTGSTVNSCARALRHAGAADVQAVTLAASRYYRHHKAMIYRKKGPENASKA